jgi:hypothetical protein
MTLYKQSTGNRTLKVEAENAVIGIFNKATVTSATGGDITLNSTGGSFTATNLLPENIKKDVNILGVVGTCEEDSGASVSGTTLVLGKASVSGTTVSV